MKKKFGRKLCLHKETIATLEQRHVLGGRPGTYTCTDTIDCTKAITCQTYCRSHARVNTPLPLLNSDVMKPCFVQLRGVKVT